MAFGTLNGLLLALALPAGDLLGDLSYAALVPYPLGLSRRLLLFSDSDLGAAGSEPFGQLLIVVLLDVGGELC